jgi:dipeptidyl aminopeptidase/acylaminoacyl peptidase
VPGGELTRRTSVNRTLFEGLRLRRPSPSTSGGIQGWLMRPPVMDAGRKYPLILSIHGGPRAMYGNAFFHEFQVLAAKGYVVLITNPRGLRDTARSSPTPSPPTGAISTTRT